MIQQTVVNLDHIFAVSLNGAFAVLCIGRVEFSSFENPLILDVT